MVATRTLTRLQDLDDVAWSGIVNGQVLQRSGSGVVGLSIGAYVLPTASASVLGGVKVGANLSIDGAGVLSGQPGTVTSVALTVPSEFSIAGSPISGAGTLAITRNTQAANLLFVGPASGGAAIPTFRTMVAADLVLHAASHITGGADVIAAAVASGNSGLLTGADKAKLDGIAAGAQPGTVTSVALTVPGVLFTSPVSGSPVTGAGTLALALNTQTANQILSGPSTGLAATPTFRALVAADLPAISLTAGVSGILPSANGGTGVNNAGSLTLATSATITGGGTLALGGFTATIPASDTVAMLGQTNAFSARQNIAITDSGTNTGVTALALRHDTSGTPTTNFGVSLRFQGQDTTTIDQEMMQIIVSWTDATHATRTAKAGFNVSASAAFTEMLRLDGGGTVQIKGVSSSQATNVLELYQKDAGTLLATMDIHGSWSLRLNNANTSSIDVGVTYDHRSSGTPAAGFGAQVNFSLQSDTTNGREAGHIQYLWVVATDASRTARMQFFADDTAARECLRLEASGSAPMVGFYAHAATIQQTATGSRGGNAALASLLTALAASGIIVDSTSA